MALSIVELYASSRSYYGHRTKKQEENAMFPAHRYSDYLRDRAVLDTLSAVIFEALAEVIGDDELEKLFKFINRQYIDFFYDYATQFVDKCNIEYLKTEPEKRKKKLKSIAKRFVQQPDSYKNMKESLVYTAKAQGCSFHELCDVNMIYPKKLNGKIVIQWYGLLNMREACRTA